MKWAGGRRGDDGSPHRRGTFRMTNEGMVLVYWKGVAESRSRW